MLPKGLLVVDPHNQTFLLVPEKDLETTGYTLSVLQLQKDQWVRLQPASSRKLRESMLGALLEFFGNLCRTLNDSDDRAHQIKRLTPKSALPAINQHPRIPAAQGRRLGRQPGKTVSKQSRPLGAT